MLSTSFKARVTNLLTCKKEKKNTVFVQNSYLYLQQTGLSYSY